MNSPVPQITETESEQKSIHFISAVETIEYIKKLDPEDVILLCEMTREENISNNTSDPRIQPLLEEFQDVFPSELPPELPPKRNIDHQIRLEVGHTHPWCPIY